MYFQIYVNTMNHEQEGLIILEGFLNKASWSHQILWEDSIAAGANETDQSKRRAQVSVQRKPDLQALVREFDTMMTSTFLDSIVKFFANVQLPTAVIPD